MEISFKTRELRKICENQSVALELFGAEESRKLQNRLADLCAARTINDVFVGSPKKIYNDQSYMYQVNFSKEKYIILAANHVNNPIDNNGSVDWKRVSRIKIVSIGGCEYG